MKKLISLLLALAMILSAASALADSTADTLVTAVESLLFHTENATLNGHAAFALDGVEFKSADGTYIRDRQRSFWQLKLHTPRPEEPEKGDLESGYTIIAEDEMVYVMEVRRPGEYKTGTVFPRTTILRPSVQVNVMDRMAHSLAQQADTLLGEGAVTVTVRDSGEKEIHIVLDENVPDLVNTALTLAFQTVAGRYFKVDYDQLDNRYMGPISAYYTVTRGIIYTTEFLYLKQADITVVLDAADELADVSGVLGAYLQTGGDGEHQLDIAFNLNVSDRGASKVDDFDPVSYGVVPANAYTETVSGEQGDI